MLTERQRALLNIIVGEYISRGVPVASEAVAHDHPLGVSPATIRNEMAVLEEEGYLHRPHISAGAVPTDRAYRYYVESLEEAPSLPLAQQRLLQHLFHQVERELEEWVRLSAVFLSRFTGNIAVITRPRAAECRLKRLELIALQEFLALMVLILWEARVKEQLLAFDRAVKEEELESIARNLNQSYSGLTALEIQERGLPSGDPLEEQVARALVRSLEAEASLEEEPYLYGLGQVLALPEFSRDPMEVVQALEEKRLLQRVLSSIPWGKGIQVIIGQENQEAAMHRFSLVVSRYGIPGEVVGTVGVVGPTRMKYFQAISAVRYLAEVLSNLVSQVHG